MIKFKILAISASALLLLLALVMSYLSIKHLGEIIPAESYEDKGVYTFYPYQVLPAQIQNTSANNKDRRINPEKTIYIIYYRAIDDSGYTWNEFATTEEQGIETWAKGETVTRRVLAVSAENSYITVEPEQTAESYTSEQKHRYIIHLALAGAYILIYAVVWCILLFRKKH